MKKSYSANICIGNSTMADSHNHAIATAEPLPWADQHLELVEHSSQTICY